MKILRICNKKSCEYGPFNRIVIKFETMKFDLGDDKVTKFVIHDIIRNKLGSFFKPIVLIGPTYCFEVRWF